MLTDGFKKVTEDALDLLGAQKARTVEMDPQTQVLHIDSNRTIHRSSKIPCLEGQSVQIARLSLRDSRFFLYKQGH